MFPILEISERCMSSLTIRIASITECQLCATQVFMDKEGRLNQGSYW